MSGRDESELARLRQRVADLERRELIAQAERIAPGITATVDDGSTDDEVRAIAVRRAHGPDVLDGACAAEIKGMFKALVAMAAEDPVRRALRTAPRDARH